MSDEGEVPEYTVESRVVSLIQVGLSAEDIWTIAGVLEWFMDNADIPEMTTEHWDEIAWLQCVLLGYVQPPAEEGS